MYLMFWHVKWRVFMFSIQQCTSDYVGVWITHFWGLQDWHQTVNCFKQHLYLTHDQSCCEVFDEYVHINWLQLAISPCICRWKAVYLDSLKQLYCLKYSWTFFNMRHYWFQKEVVYWILCHLWYFTNNWVVTSSTSFLVTNTTTKHQLFVKKNTKIKFFTYHIKCLQYEILNQYLCLQFFTFSFTLTTYIH